MLTEQSAKLQFQKKKVWVSLLCCGGLILLLNGSHATRAASGLFERIERGIASRGAVGLMGAFFQTPAISLTSSVSSCYYASGQSRKTVSVEVAWTSLTNPVTLTVSLPGAIGSTTRTISAQTTGNPPIVSPQVVAFEIPSTFTGTLTATNSADSTTATPVSLNESGTCSPLACAATDIGGTTYSDYDGDGLRDPGDNPGVGGVTVTGYDNTGMSYTTTSNNEGKYCLSVPSANYPVRVEFTSLPRSSGRVGTNSASSVQFVTAPAQNVDLSISSPEGYCETDPWVMTSCYVFGDPLATSTTAANEPAMIRARYSQDGIKTGVQSFANAGEIGATYGLAYRKQTDRLFTSAILRRHSGFGPKGLGGIYILNPNSSSNTVSATGNVVDSWSVIDQLGVAVAPTGSIFNGINGGTANAARGLVGDRTQPSRDIDAFASIGKIGIGDIDLTPDGNTLFFVNQHDKWLYSVNISGYNPANPATRPTAVNLLSKDTAAAVTCSNGLWRPSALKVTGEYAYVGGVCDGSTGTRSDLRAKVLRIPLSGGAWNTQSWTTALDFPLTYPKGYSHAVFKDLTGNDSIRMWRTWTDNFFDLEIRPNPTLTVTSTTPLLLNTSVPMLSDIEIDVDGSIILSIGDRTGLQLGNVNYAPVAAGTSTLATTSDRIDRQGAMTNSDNVICPIQFSGSRNLTGNTFYTNAVGGDILRGLIAGSSFILENGGRVGSLTGSSTSNNEGPGFGEFYADNFAYPSAPVPPRQFCGQDPHTEIAMGGLAVLPGSGEVVMTAMDPRDEMSGEATQVNAGGFRYLSNINGSQSHSLVVYSLGDDQSTQLGKSSGLGDVELSCGVINYLEIGNRIWNDADGDGVQDPGELGIPNVTVTLFQNGVQVGSSVTTDSQGRYLFNTGLLPNTAYEIRVSPSQMQSFGYSSLTFADSGLGVAIDADLRDSDAILSGGNAVIPVTTGNFGEVNHTLDMGWRTTAALTYSLGNRVWKDLNNSGTIDLADGSTPGVNGVVVRLLSAGTLNQATDANGALVADQTTSGGGYYRFDNLLAGNYVVEVRSSNFATGGPLAGCDSSLIDETDPNSDVDSNDNGVGTMPSATNGVRSGVVSLGNGSGSDEPTGDSDPPTNPGTGEAPNNRSNRTVDFGFATTTGLTYSLGNRVWRDLNNSGTIDPADGLTPGIDGVVVRLLNAGTLTQATDANGALIPDQTTSGGGYYRFDNLPIGSYVVEVRSSNFATGGPLAGCDSSLIDESDPNSDVDSNDNGIGTMHSATNGVRSGVVILGNGTGSDEPTGDNDPLSNPGTGEAPNNRSNRTVDFGFCTSSGLAYSLGNRVWKDLNNSGTIDPADGLNPGVNGVVVRLLSASTLTQATDANGALIPDQTTSGGGYYRFDNVPIGNYVVEVCSVNFAAGGPLAGCDSSLIDETDPNSDVDSNDNGVGTMPSATTGIRSGVVTIGNGTGSDEPTGDNDPSTNPLTGEAPNNRSNRTVDFGFAPSTFALGDRIWLDADLDGIQDPGEVGIDGVVVNLYKNGTLVGQTTTSGGGIYQFNNSNVILNGAAGLLPNMAYQISITTNTGLIGGMFLSPPNVDPSVNGDLSDSDAVAVGTTAVINLTTGPTPQSDFSYDIGFGVMRVTLEDPAICLTPGGIVEIVVELSNPSASVSPDGAGPELQIDLPTGITRVVSAVTQSGSSGPGVVTINGVSEILWNGALNPGDKVTLTYLVQLGSVLPGGQVCPRSTAAYDADFDGIKESTAVVDICMEINCPVVGPGLPFPIDSDASGQIAGSVLFYNIYTSSVNNARQDTRITLTNTNPLTPVYVHLFFIDGQSCAVADRFAALTPNQTISFQASDLDPEVTGYLMAVATDQSGCPIRFNYLIGSEYVKFESGHRAGLPALSIAAPGKIGCNPNQPTTTLAFDGVSYNKLPRTLALDSLFPVPDGNQAMVVVNRLGGNLSSAGSTSGQFFGLLFDDVERSSSFTLSSSSCQMRGLISPNFPRTIPRYDQVIPAGRSGWMKLWASTDEGLSGAMINFHASKGFNQGHNLHILSLTDSVTYTIPVFPAP